MIRLITNITYNTRNVSFSFTGMSKIPRIISPAMFIGIEKSRDHYLNDGILLNEKGISLPECMKKCEEFGDKCGSLSFQEKNKKCIVNNMRREDATKSAYVYEKGYVYYVRM